MKKVNVLFIYSLYDVQSLNKALYSYDMVNFGISYISSLLKRNGYDTGLLILSHLFGKKIVY